MMKRFYNLSIKTKFRTLIAVTVSFITLLMAAAFIFMTFKSHKDALNERIGIQADILAEQLKVVIFYGTQSDAKEIMSALKVDASVLRSVMVLDNGEEYAQYSRPGTDFEGIEDEKRLMGFFPRIEVYSHSFRYEEDAKRSESFFAEKKTGTIRTHVDLHDFYAHLQKTCAASLVIALLCALLAIVIAGKFIQRIIQPIFQLAETAKRVSLEKDYSIRAKVVDKDEIGKLTEDLNDMMAQIQWRDDSLEEEVKRQTADMKAAMLEAKAANAAKGEFIANISHEIRTPMNAIVNMNGFALETELTSKQRDYLTVIDISASLLLNIINDVLDMSKMDAGQLELEQIEFNPAALLNDLGYLQASKAEQKNINFILDYPLRLEHYLLGDGLRLGQVLLNLVSNAIKFTSEGEIVVAIKLLEETQKQVKLLFSVSDTGLGISEEYQQKLFDCFSQADVSTTRKYGGTGLGLYISQKLINLMGGQIQVESELGQGSRFFFTLTFDKSEKPLLNRLTDYRHYFENLNILLLNDNLAFQRVLESWFHDLGIGTKSVFDLQAAMSELETQSFCKRYDLFLIDWHSVKIDEFFSQQIFEDFESLVTIPSVVMATSREHDMMIAKNYYSLSPKVIMKPLKAESLIEAISLAVNGKGCLKVEAAGAAKKATIEEFLGETHVLLVEDNEINQQVASELLERQGIEYTIANNGKEALEALKRKTFDLVLMDIQMPEMDGYQASIVIRKNPCTKDLPIVAMTAHAMKEDIERCLASGMNDHISKPIDHDALYNVLMKYLGINRPLLTGASLEGAVVFPDVDGVDFDAGFKRISHNRAKYADVLRLFVDNYGDWSDSIKKALAEKDFKMAHMKAHTLKGAGANLGAVALSATAGRIEALIGQREFDDMDKLLVELDGQIKSFIAAIRQIMEDKVLEEGLTVEMAAVSCEGIDWKGRLEKLREMVDIHDFAANAELQALMAQSGSEPDIEQQLKRIEGELKQFRFEKVSELIAGLIASL